MSGGPPLIFDRKAVAQHRSRSEQIGDSFLIREAAEVVSERLFAVARAFGTALDVGSRSESFKILAQRATRWTRVVLDDAEILPMVEGFDLAVSVLALHAVNDLPGLLVQIRRALRPDGLFLAALLGGETLRELRDALAGAELATAGGISPRVAPLADVRDMGGLLQRAGFALPVADVERTTVRYRNVLTLINDLRAAGETNALMHRERKPMSRELLAATADTYRQRHADADGRLLATFDIIYLSGWAPHDSQQKPIQPGSAKVRLADALGTIERPTGDPANPKR